MPGSGTPGGSDRLPCLRNPSGSQLHPRARPPRRCHRARRLSSAGDTLRFAAAPWRAVGRTGATEHHARDPEQHAGQHAFRAHQVDDLLEATSVPASTTMKERLEISMAAGCHSSASSSAFARGMRPTANGMSCRNATVVRIARSDLPNDDDSQILMRGSAKGLSPAESWAQRLLGRWPLRSQPVCPTTTPGNAPTLRYGRPGWAPLRGYSGES
jgi:hypothetical protein